MKHSLVNDFYNLMGISPHDKTIHLSMDLAYAKKDKRDVNDSLDGDWEWHNHTHTAGLMKTLYKQSIFSASLDSYMMVNHTKRILRLMIPGTANIADMYQDTNLLLHSVEQEICVKLIKKIVMCHSELYNTTNHHYHVEIIGHSLGGAYASAVGMMIDAARSTKQSFLHPPQETNQQLTTKALNKLSKQYIIPLIPKFRKTQSKLIKSGTYKEQLSDALDQLIEIFFTPHELQVIKNCIQNLKQIQTVLSKQTHLKTQSLPNSAIFDDQIDPLLRQERTFFCIKSIEQYNNQPLVIQTQEHSDEPSKWVATELKKQLFNDINSTLYQLKTLLKVKQSELRLTKRLDVDTLIEKETLNDKTLCNNLYFMRQKVLQDIHLIQHASDRLKYNNDFISEAIKKDGLSLRLIPEQANNVQVVRYAIEQNPAAIQYASTDLQTIYMSYQQFLHSSTLQNARFKISIQTFDSPGIEQGFINTYTNTDKLKYLDPQLFTHYKILPNIVSSLHTLPGKVMIRVCPVIWDLLAWHKQRVITGNSDNATIREKNEGEQSKESLTTAFVYLHKMLCFRHTTIDTLEVLKLLPQKDTPKRLAIEKALERTVNAVYFEIESDDWVQWATAYKDLHQSIIDNTRSVSSTVYAATSIAYQYFFGNIEKDTKQAIFECGWRTISHPLFNHVNTSRDQWAPSIQFFCCKQKPAITPDNTLLEQLKKYY